MKLKLLTAPPLDTDLIDDILVFKVTWCEKTQKINFINKNET